MRAAQPTPMPFYTCLFTNLIYLLKLPFGTRCHIHSTRSILRVQSCVLLVQSFQDIRIYGWHVNTRLHSFGEKQKFCNDLAIYIHIHIYMEMFVARHRHTGAGLAAHVSQRAGRRSTCRQGKASRQQPISPSGIWMTIAAARHRQRTTAILAGDVKGVPHRATWWSSPAELVVGRPAGTPRDEADELHMQNMGVAMPVCHYYTPPCARTSTRIEYVCSIHATPCHTPPNIAFSLSTY